MTAKDDTGASLEIQDLVRRRDDACARLMAMIKNDDIRVFQESKTREETRRRSRDGKTGPSHTPSPIISPLPLFQGTPPATRVRPRRSSPTSRQRSRPATAQSDQARRQETEEAPRRFPSAARRSGSTDRANVSLAAQPKRERQSSGLEPPVAKHPRNLVRSGSQNIMALVNRLYSLSFTMPKNKRLRSVTQGVLEDLSGEQEPSEDRMDVETLETFLFQPLHAQQAPHAQNKTLDNLQKELMAQFANAKSSGFVVEVASVTPLHSPRHRKPAQK